MVKWSDNTTLAVRGGPGRWPEDNKRGVIGILITQSRWCSGEYGKEGRVYILKCWRASARSHVNSCPSSDELYLLDLLVN